MTKRKILTQRKSKSITSSPKSTTKSKAVKPVKRNTVRYFDKVKTFRWNDEMERMVKYWVSHPKCVDTEGNPLFMDASHFIKVSLIKHFKELKQKYNNV